ncbi:MAG: ECF transporter S component [Lachnoclostridium sp.]|jgi:niacin transporter|nr:ECF transporter S component [Lachnoclostridium sp.]
MKTKKLTLGAVMLALAILLPQVFHLTGISRSGEIFLPMHIPILLAGFFLGPWYGLVIGMSAPIISFFLTAMPALPRLPSMVVEVGIYGMVCGYLYCSFMLYRKKQGILISLLVAMVVGRLAFALTLFIASNILGLKGLAPIAAWEAVIIGIPGIIIQILLVPAVVYALKRGGITDDFFEKSQKRF